MTKKELISATGRQATRYNEDPLYQEGLYDLGNRVYAWLVPNGSWGESNAGLVVGDGEALLVDTLWDLGLTREMLRAMDPVCEEAPLKYLVNTHADGDHIWGNQLLEGAEVLMTAACDEEARAMKPAAMTMMGKLGKAMKRFGTGNAKKAGNYLHNMVAPYDFKGIEVKGATRICEGETVLEVGGREVRLIEVGPAHTLGDLLVHVPDARTVFCGDIMFLDCTPVLWAGPVENWIAALDMILGLDVDIVVPGHGAIGDKSSVSRLKEYWEFLQQEVGRRFSAGLSAKEAAYDIALSGDFAGQVWSQWDSPERIMTNVHMMYRHLHLQGRMKHVTPADKLKILYKQGILAFELPQARPASARTL